MLIGTIMNLRSICCSEYIRTARHFDFVIRHLISGKSRESSIPQTSSFSQI